MLILFLSELIIRSSFAMTQTLFLLYAFYVLQIGGPLTKGLLLQEDPALQLARIRWRYVTIALFICMVFASFPPWKADWQSWQEDSRNCLKLSVNPSCFIVCLWKLLNPFYSHVINGSFNAFRLLFLSIIKSQGL